jgi:hypothetical protein
MTQHVIPSAAVEDWNVYEEFGVLVFGVRLARSSPVARSLIFQIDMEGSEQREDAWGMHSEIDNEGGYNVSRFTFDRLETRLDIEFDRATSSLPRALAIYLPPSDQSQFDLLRKMSETFRIYPSRRTPGD